MELYWFSLIQIISVAFFVVYGFCAIVGPTMFPGIFSVGMELSGLKNQEHLKNSWHHLFLKSGLKRTNLLLSFYHKFKRVSILKQNPEKNSRG